ncbi:YhdP family protein [Geomonas sp. Red276]
MPTRPKRPWLLPLILGIISLVVVGASLSLRYLDLDTYKAQIVSQVRSALKRDLSYHSGDFSLRYGPSFTFWGVTIKEKDGVTDFIKTDRLILRIAILPLLHGKIALSRMRLDQPDIRLSRDASGTLNISDLFNRPEGGAAPGIGGIEVKKGRITFTDLAVGSQPLATTLTDTDLYLSRLTRGKSCDIELSGSLVTGSRRVPIFVGGDIVLPRQNESWKNCVINGRVKTGGVDIAHFWPYYGRFLPFKSLGGTVALQGNFKGRPGSFHSRPEFTIAGLQMDYPQVFHAHLNPRLVKGSCDLELKDQHLAIDAIKLDVDGGLKVQGSCRLSDLDSKDIRITAKATTSRFNLADYRQFIPYGIIVKDTADFIERKILGGRYRLEEGRLDGRVSQILHMEKGQNYNILYVRAHVDDGVVAYGGGFPVVSAIGGELFMEGKDFILKGMKANFGTSPMTLDGRITDYPLDTPCRYPFTAVVQPRLPEAAWVLGHPQGLALSEGGVVKITADGGTSAYRMTCEADLAKAAYALPDLVVKPQGRPNTVALQVTFEKELFRITGLTYHLAPLTLNAATVSHYDGPMSLELKTNQFQVGEVAPLLPALAKYHPAGKVQANLHGTGPSLAKLNWGGSVDVAGVSLRPGEKFKPVTGATGTLKFSGETVETSQLTVRLGSSIISGHGSLTGFKSPAVSAVFTSPSLDLADVGIPAGKHPVRAERVQGTITYNQDRDRLQISSLSGYLGKSQLHIRGAIEDLQHPKGELSVNSSHLEVEDLTPVFGSGGGEMRPTLKIHLAAAEGRWKDIQFQRLKAVATIEDKVLELQPLDFGTMEGEVNAKGRVELGPGPTRYQLTCSMEKVSADQLLRVMGVKKQELTGTVSAKGELTARGDSALELRKSVSGNVKLRAEKGTLKRFATLSKIFSILNVSQLFRGKLPDMVSGGMPYNKITGDFSIKDGVATTQNLFMDSNAINLSAVGKLDLGRDEIDMNIGVQPLQTVDKVVSRIPIVGWILTGKDHSLITTYFEAKGKIEDPQVKAVPVKSLAKGVINIFKRVFELPARLITDTGEVIIGK